MHPTESAIIRACIASNRRDRWLAMLDSPKRRREHLDKLNHLRDLDERFARWLPSSADALALLRANGAPADCYVISPVRALDGQAMEIAQTIEAINNSMSGAIVSCIDGKLAYYQGEAGESCALLVRAGDA